MQLDQNKKSKKKKALFSYAKYAGLSFQMIAIILIFTFGGIKLDSFGMLNFPLFTVLGVILGVALSLYFAIKDLLKK